MADDEEIGAMMAENVTLKDLVAEQNETQNLLRQQLADLTETLQTLQGSNSNSVLGSSASTQQAINERNELLRQWVETAQTWESMFTHMEAENAKLRAALKALTN